MITKRSGGRSRRASPVGVTQRTPSAMANGGALVAGIVPSMYVVSTSFRRTCAAFAVDASTGKPVSRFKILARFAYARATPDVLERDLRDRAWTSSPSGAFALHPVPGTFDKMAAPQTG